MATDKEYLTYILDGLDKVKARAMMGEYVLYCGGKVVGGLYDDRLLIKPTKSACALLPDAPKERPYEGAKEMLFVEETDDKAFLQSLLETVSRDLP